MRRRLKGFLSILFLIFGLALLIIMYLFFKGHLELTNKKEVLVDFSDVSGLKVGDPVWVLGMEKGRVMRMELVSQKVRVRIALDKSVQLGSDSKFIIKSMSYLGTDRFLLIIPGTAPELSEMVFQGSNESLDLERTLSKIDALIDTIAPIKIVSEFRRAKDELITAIREELKGIHSSFTISSEGLIRLTSKLDSLAQFINTQSTIKRLLTSEELYQEILLTNQELRDLIADIKQNPQKYSPRIRLLK